jgi:hypothetical protein
MSAVIGGIVIIGLGFQRGLGAAMHVLLDVMYHFYERDFKFPPLSHARPMTLENFVVEMRIEYRLRRVL